MKPIVIALSLIALMSVAGCGKKGPLEPPPNHATTLHQPG